MQRRTTVLSIVLLLAFFAIGVGIVSRLLFGGHVPLVSADRVAILPVTGIIESDSDFQGQLERFRDDPSVRAFVVEIRSPGGVAGTTQSIYAELSRLRDTDERPVVAWIGEVGASGGYYVALAADSILTVATVRTFEPATDTLLADLSRGPPAGRRFTCNSQQSGRDSGATEPIHRGTWALPSIGRVVTRQRAGI